MNFIKNLSIESGESCNSKPKRFQPKNNKKLTVTWLIFTLDFSLKYFPCPRLKFLFSFFLLFLSTLTVLKLLSLPCLSKWATLSGKVAFKMSSMGTYNCSETVHRRDWIYDCRKIFQSLEVCLLTTWRDEMEFSDSRVWGRERELLMLRVFKTSVISKTVPPEILCVLTKKVTFF